MTVPKIFKDSAQQELFDKQGFLIMPFLNQEEIAHMDKLFDELHPNLPSSGFFAGSYSPDFEYKKRVSEEIKVVYKRRYDEVFENYTAFGGAFLFKIPSPDSDLYMHQDWTVVDESENIALNIWVPLCDITPENGPLMVLPGSHYKNFPVIRSPTMPQFFDKAPQVLKEEMEMILVKAGEAVILNQSLVHYSIPNNSPAIRKAITAGVKTRDTQLIFHYKDAARTDKMIEKFEMSDDFFILFENFFTDIFQKPKMGRSIGFIEYEVPVLEPDELMKLVREMKTGAGFPLREQRVEMQASPVEPAEVAGPQVRTSQRPLGLLSRLMKLLN
jgi:hypothetical protein